MNPIKWLLAAYELIPANHRQKVTYLFVGGLLFVIDFSVTITVFHLFDIRAGLASACGFLASFFVGFTLSKKLVFRHTSTSKFPLRTQVALYFSLAVTNLIVTSLIVNFFVDHGTRIEIIKPIMVAAAACWNYVILGTYIFGHTKPEA